MAAKKKESKRIVIPRTNTDTIALKIRGCNGPLVTHAWSQKAIGEMLGKQMASGVKLLNREAKSPEQDYQQSLYSYQEDGATRYGFPATAFKDAMVRATKLLKIADIIDLDMITAKQLFYVLADGVERREIGLELPDGSKTCHVIETQLVRIDGEPTMRMDMVRIGKGTADVRFRGQFTEWQATVKINYNSDVLQAEHVANLLYRAGESVGIGEGRREKGDQGWGQFEIVESKTTNKKG